MDVIISLTIPEDKVTKALQGFLKIYPNNEMVPDEETGEPTEEHKYTDKQWVTEQLRRLAVRDIKRGLGMIRNEEVAQVEDTEGMVI